MSSIKNETQVVTDECRLSYLHVFQPYAGKDGNMEPKYSACILIPKNAKKTIAYINEAIKNATDKGLEKKWNNKLPKKFGKPLKDGDEYEELDSHPEFEGCYYINASNKRRPGLINSDRSDIFSEDELKSGDYGKVHLSFYAYSANGNNGVACGLENILKTRDGEALGGARIKAEDAFEDEFEDEDGLLD